MSQLANGGAAQDWGQLLNIQVKTCSHFRSFTTSTVDPDSWLSSLDGLHLERKVDRNGMVSVDLKRYYVSAQLVGHHVSLQLDAEARCVHVYLEEHPLKSLPLRGLVGRSLSYEQFLAHMLHQARAQARLRSLQERKYRTAAVASP